MSAQAAVAAPVDVKACELRLDRARWWALSEQPFYGALLMRLQSVVTPGAQTAETDGRVVRINPEWMSKLSDQELRFVLLHETLHCAHQHMWRLPPTKRGNIAGDHAINLTLQALPGVSMPAGGCADPQFQGMAEEDILAKLPEDDDGGGQGQEPGQGAPDPCGAFGAPADPSGGQDAQQQAQAAAELREEWGEAVMQAAQAAQAMGRGHLPADLQRQLERVQAQPIDWRRELAEFLRQAGAGRNDWARPARRHAWGRVLFPRRRPDDLGVIVCARDTSGSIDDRVAAEFAALIDECAATTGARILLVDCDAAIQAEHWIEPGQECPRYAAGGGGTDFRPVFERVDQLTETGEHVAGVVYLTDLEGPEPAQVDLPTLWLCTTDRQARTGRTVRVQS